MSDYIEREAALAYPIRKDKCDRKHANKHFILGIESVIEFVENLPAADVAPVVRCSQCVHHEDNGYHFCNKWEHFLPDDSEFFCAFGERKEANT